MEDSYCAICYETNSLETLTCNHEFCKECIHKWKEEKMSCPVCRHVITPNLTFSTRCNFYGEDSNFVHEYWKQIIESDRMIQFLSQLALANHYIQCKDLQYEKKHFLNKKVLEYANKLFDAITDRFHSEKQHYDTILRYLLIVYEPKKRMENYQEKMTKLFEAISKSEIEKYKSNAQLFFINEVQHDSKLCEIRDRYIQSKLVNYHQDNIESLKEELVQDEIFLEEQYFIKTFHREADVSGVFLEENNIFDGVPMEYAFVSTEENDSNNSSDLDITEENDEASSEVDITEENDESSSEVDDLCDCDPSLQNMIVKFEDYMMEPLMKVEDYVKNGSFQKDFMWVMKNIFLYSFFDVETNLPISAYLYSHSDTIKKILCFLGLTNSIYQEALDQYIELYTFLERGEGCYEKYHEVMKTIVEENI